MADAFEIKDGVTQIAGSDECSHGVFHKRDCYICEEDSKTAKLKKEEDKEAKAKDVENPNGESNTGEKES